MDIIHNVHNEQCKPENYERISLLIYFTYNLFLRLTTSIISLHSLLKEIEEEEEKYTKVKSPLKIKYQNHNK